MKKLEFRKPHFVTIARILIVVYIISMIVVFLQLMMDINHLVPLDILLDIFQRIESFIIFGFLPYLLSLIIIIGDIIFHHRLRNIIFVIFSILISIPISMLFLLIFMGTPEHSLSSIILDDHQYILTFSSGDFGEYTFYECDKNGYDCKSLSKKSSSNIEDSMKLVYYEKNDSIIAFQKRASHTWVSFIYRGRIQYIDWEQIEEFHNDVYMLNSSMQKDSRSYFVSKCIDENESIGSCEILPFGYTSNEKKDVKLFSDKISDELQVLANDEIIYSFNGQSNCLSSECRLTPFN